MLGGLPVEALDDRLAFIGTSGSGKTYGAGTAVETLLARKAKAVIVDPLGVWWGLRLNADGKAPGFGLPIFGGAHGDLPLNEHAGKIIGETIAGMRESCIVDLSGLQTKEAERRFMLAFLESLYRNAGGEPMHAVFDEADLWAPQNPSKQGAGPQLQSLMEQIVRRGRVRGFIPWLITQRPAVVSKDVLSQADGLVAFKLTASQDRKALGAWVTGQADEGQWAAIDRELPAMPRGRAVVWLPGRGVMRTTDFPAKATFDSSRTPKRGEKRVQRDLKSLDLEGLKEKLATVEADAKANNPVALKQEITRLTREMAKAQPAPWPDLRKDVSDLRGYITLLEGKLAAVAKVVTDAPFFGPPMGRPVSFEQPKPPPAKAPAKAQIRNESVPGDGEIPPGCGKPLAALAAVYPSGLTEAQWALSARYKRTGGTWGAYKRRLRAAGLIVERDGKFFATEAGAAAVGDIETPPAPGPELVRWWASKLPGTLKLAEALIESYPQPLSKEELAARVGMEASGGSFGAYVRRLASPGLIDRGDGIKLADEVMGA